MGEATTILMPVLLFIVSAVLCFFHGAVLAQLASAVFVFLIIREKKEAEPKEAE